MMASRRDEIYEEARRLIRGGISRRRMDVVLREKYGRSVGHAAHKRLFNERVQQIAKREAQRVTGYRSPRTRKQQRYTRLVRAHFLPEEAKLLASRLKTLKYHEIAIMTAGRDRLYQRFLRHAAEQGYSRAVFQSEWRSTVENWYNRTVVKWQRSYEKSMVKRGFHPDKSHDFTSLLWRWFGHVKSELPPELQAYAPKHKRKTQKPPTVDKIQTSRWINGLKKSLKETTDPKRQAELRQQIKRLQESIR